MVDSIAVGHVCQGNTTVVGRHGVWLIEELKGVSPEDEVKMYLSVIFLYTCVCFDGDRIYSALLVPAWYILALLLHQQFLTLSNRYAFPLCCLSSFILVTSPRFL